MTLPQTTKWYKTVAPRQVLRDRLMAGIHIIDLASEVESLQKQREELVGLLRWIVESETSLKTVRSWSAPEVVRNSARVREILELQGN